MKIFLTLLFFIFLSTVPAYAETTAGASAMLVPQNIPFKQADKRIQVLKSYFKKYNSPLENDASVFIEVADKYDIDYRILPAIAGVESGFGKFIPYNSFNGWGWGIYGGKVTYFSSWEEAIQTISKELRERYMDKWGAKNVYDIGKYYASDPAWAYKVNRFMEDIENFAQEKEDKAISISI